MPRFRKGNPKPRLARRPADGALVNCMGLPSRGLDYAVRNLRRYRAVHSVGGPPIIANVGGFSKEDILSTFRATEPYVDAVELDLTCPNVKVEGEMAEMGRHSLRYGLGYDRADQADFHQAASTFHRSRLAEGH